MKNYKVIILGALMPLLFGASGCLEVHVRTNISSDGSAERVITMSLASRELPDNAFPVPVDSTWTVDWKEIHEKDVKYEYTARKIFKTREELQYEYAAAPDTGRVGIRVTLQKRFEWFFTYLDYNETYTFNNPFNAVPVSDYLTTDEVRRYVYGDKSDTLKYKVKRWESRNLLEEVYRPLVAEAQRRHDSALPASLLEEKKEEYFDLVVAVDSANDANKKGDKSKADSAKDNLDNPEGLIRLLAKVTGTDAVYTLLPAARNAMAALERNFEMTKHPDGWQSSVQMPGMILETNSNAVEGNAMTWKFDAGQLEVGGYEMHASSRVTNVWAFVVTGIVALLILLPGLRAVFRSR